MGKRNMTDPHTVPRHGPYATAVWDGDRWHTPLTAEGKAFLAAWVAKHGSGIGLLKSKRPDVYAFARSRGLTDDEIVSACHLATVTALTLYEPDAAGFPHFFLYHLRSAVCLSARRWGKAQEYGVLYDDRYAVAGDRGDLFDRLDATGDDTAPPDDSAAVAETGDTLRRAAASVLPARDLSMLWARYGLDGHGGRTLAETAAAFGVTKERVRQIEARSLARLRRHLTETAPATADAA